MHLGTRTVAEHSIAWTCVVRQISIPSFVVATDFMAVVAVVLPNLATVQVVLSIWQLGIFWLIYI